MILIEKRGISLDPLKTARGRRQNILSIGQDTAIAGNEIVMAADLDLGVTNLHTCLDVLGHTPTIKDFILGKGS